MPRVGTSPVSPLHTVPGRDLAPAASASASRAVESATPLSTRQTAGTPGLRLARLPAFSTTGFVRIQADARAGAASSAEQSFALCLSMLTHSRGLQRLPPPKAMKPADAAHQLGQLREQTNKALGGLEDLQTAGHLDRAKVADCRQDMLDLNAQLRDVMASLSTLDAAALLNDDHSNQAVKESTTHLCGPQYARLEQGLVRLHTQTAAAQLAAHPASPDGTLSGAGRQAPEAVLSDAVGQISTLAISARDGLYYADQHVTAAKLRARLERGDFAASPDNTAAVAGHLAVWEQMHAQYGGTVPPNTAPGAYARLAPAPAPGADR